jgi:hypothetical protein
MQLLRTLGGGVGGFFVLLLLDLDHLQYGPTVGFVLGKMVWQKNLSLQSYKH